MAEFLSSRGVKRDMGYKRAFDAIPQLLSEGEEVWDAARGLGEGTGELVGVLVLGERLLFLTQRLGTFGNAILEHSSVPYSDIVSVNVTKGRVFGELTAEAQGGVVRQVKRLSGVETDRLGASIATRRSLGPQTNEAPQNGSLADEIRKLAQLRDEGILTETEFEAQKQRLLDGQ